MVASITTKGLSSSRLEHIVGAEAGHLAQLLPPWGRLVEVARIASLASVQLHHPAVQPQVRDGHLVLCEGARLVGADDAGGAQGLHALQILHQAVLLGHPLCSQGQRDCYSGQ